MPKSQPLDKQPQQHQIDAYGGIEAGTSRSAIFVNIWRAPVWLTSQRDWSAAQRKSR